VRCTGRSSAPFDLFSLRLGAHGLAHTFATGFFTVDLEHKEAGTEAPGSLTPSTTHHATR